MSASARRVREPRRIAEAGPGRVGRPARWLALGAMAWLAAAGAPAQMVRLPPPSATGQPAEGHETVALPPPLNLRPTQIIRCNDARGNVILQDVPCKPVSAQSASAAADVVELSALESRPPAATLPAPAPEAEARSVARGMLDGSWKLALFVLACYLLYRGARIARDAWREKFPAPAPRSQGPRRVR